MRVISSCWLRPCPLYTPPVARTDWVNRRIIQAMSQRSVPVVPRKVWRTISLRGRRSRIKVYVGEPAEGSFARFLSIFSELFRDAGAWREIFAFLMSWAVALCVIAKCEKRLREIFVCIVFTISYNLQRWMSRLEQRWRAQRSAISIVNCRIPWIDRNLNAYCTLGISWECACFSVIFIFVVVVTLFWLLLVSSLRR